MRILFLGPPGSGKGTQSKNLAEKLKNIHLSSGDLLREAVAQNTPAGKEAKSYMDAGKLVPDPVLIQMFREKLSQREAAAGFILDGFPRNVAQAKSLDQLLAEFGGSLDSVLNLIIEDSYLTERITGRRSCTKCGAVYHVKFAPTKQPNVCDVCGGPVVQRSDDTPELVKQRLDTYREKTEPLIDYYDSRRILKTIDADGDPSEVFSRILLALRVAV
jgi:adenylate kinase